MTRGFSIPTLRTARLHIRELTDSDLDACIALLRESRWDDGDGDVRARRTTWLSTTIANYRHKEELRYPPFGARAMDTDESRCIGIVGFVPSFEPFGRLPSFGEDSNASVTLELGIFVGLREQHRGSGYAAEGAQALVRHAFESLKMERVVATAAHDNTASIATMKRLGMTVETHPSLYEGRLAVGCIRRSKAA